jgi:hypothetical protein
VDLSADVVSRADILHGTLSALRDDTTIDVWLVFGRPIVDRYYQAFIEFASATRKAMIVSCGVPIAAEIQAALRAGGIAVLDDPALCLRALGRIVRAGGRTVACAAGARGQGAGFIAGARSTVTATIETDRDFGRVLALSTPHVRTRVVRALPATADDLRDALEEIAGIEVKEGPLDRLCEFAMRERSGAAIEVRLDA